jgi:ectoine hydroxylase
MRLTPDQIDDYAKRGYVTVTNALSAAEVTVLRSCLDQIYSQENPPMVRERDGTVRLCFAPHIVAAPWTALTRHPAVLQPTQQLLGGDVYVHQSKITAKSSLEGGGWPWHQDFHFWKKRDLVPKPQMLSVIIFLDDVTLLNGPIYIVSGTQNSDLTDGDEYHLSRPTMAWLCQSRPIDVPTGPAGTIVFLDSLVVHGSPSNITPYERTLGFITYNRVGNHPTLTDKSPTEAILGRDFRPLQAADVDVVLRSAL